MEENQNTIEEKTESQQNGDLEKDGEITSEEPSVESNESLDDEGVDFQNSDDLDSQQNLNNNNSSKKQSARKNKKYAEIRMNAIKEVCPKNTYTGEKIETEEDYEEYKIMKEMEQQNLDPLNTIDYRKFKRAKEAEAIALKEEQQRIANENNAKAKQKFENDFKEFTKSHPNIDLNTWFNEIPKERKGLNNEKNQQYLDDKKTVFNAFISSGMTMSEAYELFNRINGSLNIDIANQIAQQKIQNSLASSGSQIDGNNDIESKKDYLNMSDEEFKKIQNLRFNRR